MKKTVALLLCLLLVLSCTGCASLPFIGEKNKTEKVDHPVFVGKEEESKTEVPAVDTEVSEETETGENDTADESAEEETAEESAAETEPETTTAYTDEEIAKAEALYVKLFATGLTQVNDVCWQLNACEVLSADPTTYSPHGYNPLYCIDSFTMIDLDGDGIRELILCQGEVEREAYVFTTRNGQVDFCCTAYIDNQSLDAPHFYLFQTADGATRCFTIGESGTGAGILSFVHELNPDLTRTELFTTFEFAGEMEYEVNGESVDAAAYDAAYNALFDSLTLIDQYYFMSFSTDIIDPVDDIKHYIAKSAKYQTLPFEY